MSVDTSITFVDAREILDSRGNPTIEVDVVLADGSIGRAAVPSGASTGVHEAVELRDGDKERFGGKGVRKAVRNVTEEIGPAVLGPRCRRPGRPRQRPHRPRRDAQQGPPRRERDPRRLARRRPRVGRGRSTCRSTAISAGSAPGCCRCPMFNILNGGKHAQDSTDFQEFMVMPVGAGHVSPRRSGPAPRSSRPFAGSSTTRATPPARATRAASHRRLPSNQAAVEVILRAIEAAGYRPGEQVAIALDPATSSILEEGTGIEGVTGRYRLEREGRTLDSGELIDLWADWIARYPIVSLEDGLAEDDWAGWVELTKRLGDRVQLVGDDIIVTNPDAHRARHPRAGDELRRSSSSTRSGP